MIDGGLRKLFREHLPDIHWQSVETGGTGRGVPDSNGCADGVEFWVEFKVTSGWAVGLRPEQRAWLARRTRCGGRCWVAVRRQAAAGERRGPAADQLWLLPAAVALEISGLRQAPAAHLLGAGGPGRWGWAAVRAALLDRSQGSQGGAL